MSWKYKPNKPFAVQINFLYQSVSITAKENKLEHSLLQHFVIYKDDAVLMVCVS